MSLGTTLSVIGVCIVYDPDIEVLSSLYFKAVSYNDKIVNIAISYPDKTAPNVRRGTGEYPVGS
jgi:hypothetical protein